MPPGPWQPWVDENMVGSGQCAAGIIMTLEGAILAYSPCLQITQEEMTKIANALAITDQDTFETQLGMDGVTVSGAKYMLLRAFCEEGLVYCKLKQAGLCITRTGCLILIGVYTNGITPGQCNMCVEGLAEYLVEQGY